MDCMHNKPTRHTATEVCLFLLRARVAFREDLGQQKTYRDWHKSVCVCYKRLLKESLLFSFKVRKTDWLLVVYFY